MVVLIGPRFRVSLRAATLWGAILRDVGSCGLRIKHKEVRMNTERAVFVYTTYPSLVEAEQAGRALVERQLCACVNILPGMISYYRWRGAVERGEEVVMIIKTRASLAERVRAVVREMHS